MPPETLHESTRPEPSSQAETRDIAELEESGHVEPNQANMDPAFHGIVLPWEIWCLILDFV